MKTAQPNTITFGVEVECILPSNHPFQVGGYHRGIEMDHSYEINGETIVAPSYNGQRAKCEYDSSLRANGSGVGVEIITPVLKGEEGRQFVIDLFKFIKLVGGRVNRSCGQHIHLGLESITGSNATPSQVTMFLAELIKKSSNLQYGAYAQTGSLRNQNSYSSELRRDESIINIMREKINDRSKKHGVGNTFSDSDIRSFEA